MTATEPDTITMRLAAWARTARENPGLITFTAVTYIISTLVVLILHSADYAGAIHTMLAPVAALTGLLTSTVALAVPVALIGRIGRRARYTTLAVALPVALTFAVLPVLASGHRGWPAAMSAIIGGVYDLITFAVIFLYPPWELIDAGYPE